jgi:hypothetical protein
MIAETVEVKVGARTRRVYDKKIYVFYDYINAILKLAFYIYESTLISPFTPN